MYLIARIHERCTEKDDFAIGLVLTLAFSFLIYLLSIAAFVLLIKIKFLSVLSGIFALEVLLFGLIQYSYIVPISITQIEKGNKQLVYGIILGSLIVLGLNFIIFIFLGEIF